MNRSYFPKRFSNYFASGDERQTGLLTESTPDGDSVYLDKNSVDIPRDKHRNKLGEGSFARVYEGKYRGQPCAVKVFKEDVLRKQNDIESYLCNPSNPNIIRIHGLWIDPYKDRNALSIVMELCDTSLHEYIKSHKVRGMPKGDKQKILHDVANAMIYLHNEHIVHGDLRSPNVLLVNTGFRRESSDEQLQITAKVADFDLARHVDPKTRIHYTTTFADEDYLPPEAIDEEKFKDRKHVRLTFSVDVFCFGPLAIELACMEFPKPAVKVERKKGQVVKVLDEIERRGKYLRKIDFSERMYTDLIVKQCMADKPEERGSFLDLQLIIEAFQKKMQERPDHDLLEEQQAEIFDMRRKMEEDAKTLSELETLRVQLHDMSKSNEEFQEKLQQAEKDLAKVTTERDVQKSNNEGLLKSLGECQVQLGQSEKENKTILENRQMIVIEKDGYYRETVEAKNQLAEMKEKADEFECSLHSAEATLQELKNQLSKQEKVNQDANRDRLNLKQVLKRTEEECQSLKRYEDQCKKYKAQLKEEEEKLRAAESAKTLSSTKLEDAEKSLKDSIAQLKEEEEKLTAAEKEKTSLSTRLTKAEESLENTKAQLKEEKEKLRAAENAKTLLSTKSEDAEKSLKDSIAQLKEEEEKLTAAEKEKTSLSTRLTKAEESLENTKAQLKEEEEKLTAAEKEKTSLSTRLTKAEESLENTKAHLKEEEEKLRAAENAKTLLSTKSEDAEKSLKDSIAQLKEEEEKLTAAEKEKTSLSTRLTKAEESLENTKAQLKEEEEKLRASENTKTLLSTKLEYAEKSLKDSIAQLKGEEEKLRAAEKEKTSLSTRLMKAEESLEDTKKTYDALLGEKKELEKEKETLKGEKYTLNRSNESLQGELEKLKTVLTGKQQELSSVLNEVSELRAKEETSKQIETSLRTEVDKVLRSKGELADEVKKLRANQNKTEKAEKLKGQLDKMSTDLEKVKHSKEEAEDEVKKLRANLKKTEKMEKSLKEQLEKISPELEKVKRLKELAENEVRVLRDNQKIADKAEKTLKGQVDKLSTDLERVKRLKEEAESKQKKSENEHKHKLAELTQKVKSFETSRSAAEKELREAKQLNLQMTQQKEVLDGEKVQLKEKIRKLRADLQTSEDAKTALNTKLAETGKSLKNTKSKLEECNKENEELSRDLDGLQKAKTAIEEELYKTEVERDSALKTARELEVKLATETDAVKESKEKWRKSHHLFSKEKKTLGDQCSKMEEQLEEEERMKEQAVQELGETKLKADALEREKEALEKSTLLLEDELNRKRAEVNHSKRISNDLEEQLKNAAKQCDELKQKCEELTHHSEDAKKSLQAEEEKCKRLEENLEQTQKQLQKKLTLSSQSDDGKSRKIQDLEKDKKYLSKKLEEVNVTVESQKDLVSKLENEKEDLQKEINRLNQSNAKLKSDYEKKLQLADHRANEEIQKLKRKHSNMEDKLREKVNTLHQKQREIEDLSAKVHESQELLEKEKEVKQRMEVDCRNLENNLQSEKKRHKETAEEYQTKTALLEGEKGRLLTKMALLQDEKGRLLTEMANLAEAGDRLVQEKEELGEQLVNKEATIKALKVNRDELADEKESLQGTLVDLKEERDNLKSNMADLEKVKGELLQERMCLEEKLTEAAIRCDDLQEARSDLEEKFSNLEQQHVSSLQINEDEMTLMKEELNETQCKLQEKQTEHDSTLKLSKTLQSALDESHECAGELKVRNDHLVGELEQLRCKLQEKQTEHDSTLKLSKKLQSALDESHECAGELKVRNDHLVGELEQLRTSECALSAVVNEKEEELTKLTLAVEDYKGKFEGARVQHGKLIEKFEALAIEKEDWQRKCEEFAGVNERLKLVISENENLEKESKRLKGSVAEYKERIRLLDKEVTERTCEIENLEKERGSLKQALHKSEERSRLLDKEAKERTCEIKNLEEERDSLKQALHRSEEKLLACSADLDSTGVQLVHFKGECERVQVKFDQVQNENVRMHERLLHSEKVHKRQIDVSENDAASRQSAIVRLWAESYVDEMVEQVLEGQLQKVTAKLEDLKLELNGREEELTTVTDRLAEKEQKCQQLQYQESHLSEELANIKEDLRRERVKCARYRDEVLGLENAQMDVVVQKDAIERDLTVLRGKHEQSQKELSQHKLRLSVVERDFRQAKDAENQLRAQCEEFKINKKTLVEENAVYRKALEAKTASSLHLQEENMQLRVLKKQEKQIKSQKQTLRQGRKALQQDMVELEKKKASLEGKQELLQECSMLTRQSLEVDRKLQMENFKEFRQEQLIAVDRMCNKIDKSLRQQRKEQQQHQTRQQEEQELAMKKLEQSGESVLRRLEHDLHNAKGKEEVIGSEVQKVSKQQILDVQANSEVFKLLQKFEIVCRLLNCYVPDIVNPTNDGLCEASEEMTSTCNLDSFTVFDACNVQHLQFKLPVAVRNFVESLRPLIRGPSIVCSLPFIVYTENVCFCHLLLATSPFLIAADPKDVLQMEPTLVCVLAMATLTGDIEQEIITCQRKWENICKGVIFHPTWGQQEPKPPLALRYPSVKLPVKLEPVLEQLNLGMARKLHECKPELVQSLIPYYLEECKK